MANAGKTPQKTKRPRGANWSDDGLKALLDMAILRRAKIRGANAPQDQRDDAWEEIADAVSAIGVPRTVEECKDKLRCYTSEVKSKFKGIWLAAAQTGGEGGTPTREMQPTQLEELALAYLGVEKVYGFKGGRATKFKSVTNFQYTEERQKEIAIGEELDQRFKTVAREAAKNARKKYLKNKESSSDTDEGERNEDTLVAVRKRRKATKKKGGDLGRGIANTILNGQEAIEDRLIRMEHKLENMSDQINTVREFQARRQDIPIDDVAPAVPVENGENAENVENGSQDTEDIETPPAGIFYHALLEGLQAFLNEADDDMWGKLMVAALRTTEAGQRREATYLGLLSNCSEDEIDAIQKFFIDNCALLKPLPNANQYRVLVAAGNDLVANRRLNGDFSDAFIQNARACMLLTLERPESPTPTIRETLAEVFPEEPMNTDDNPETKETKETPVKQIDPTPGPSGENVGGAQAAAFNGNDDDMSSQDTEVNEDVQKTPTTRSTKIPTSLKVGLSKRGSSKRGRGRGRPKGSKK